MLDVVDVGDTGGDEVTDEEVGEVAEDGVEEE